MANQAPMLQAVRWLLSGGTLVVFPAGDVSYPDWKRRASIAANWNPSVARIIRMGRAAALPLFFHGSNSASFHLLGKVHPGLRALLLPAELLNKRGRSVQLRIGRTLAPQTLAAMTDEGMIEHLRARTYLLGHRPKRRHGRPAWWPARSSATPGESVPRHVEALPARNVLWETNEWSVLCYSSTEAPELMSEVGRLREEAFRAAGEGTGRPFDLDRFDSYYDQMVLWNKKKREIAGGYRLGRSEVILGRLGIDGLYTSTLFQFQPEFFRRIGPAVELGRSFVRTAYQKQFTPLLVLWQGIGAYVCRHPECRFLFGAVSVSSAYEPLSRHILETALLNAASDPRLLSLVKPRCRLNHALLRSAGEE